MNRIGKHSAWTVAVLSMLLMGTACSSDKDNSNASASVTPSASSSASASATLPSDPGASDPAVASPDDSPSPTPSPSPSADTLDGTGTYNGLGDANSIEIQFNGQPTPFRIDPSIADKLSGWEEGTAVKFQYTETTIVSDGNSLKQYTIVSIDKQ
ncbi:hypothetical protein [Cohnella zeiphila]|uniref:Uncharacterized protein n=1 Tax=Cohnella zeiphila TaxID=2761120 RepID=A0A7X0SJD0_9BACL|nr:hypothetical protein [Cohnella zeiphila]MBB6730976.1 hypothetical protein [Cohnella zeiphila]